MDLGLGGRVAMVAAASNGVDRAVAEELAREGAEVTICARSAAELAKAAGSIGPAGGRDVFWKAVGVGDAGTTLWRRRHLRYQHGPPAV